MKLNAFAKYAWVYLGYTVIVILWGGIVRATGSGAGCGAHWPACNGLVVPGFESWHTAVEFSHRISVGIGLLATVVLVVWAFRAWPKGHLVRKGAVWVAIMMIVESLVGAALVLLQLVAYNVSLARAFWMAGHLVSTFLLLGVIALTAWWASGGEWLRLRGQGWVLWTLVFAAIAMFVLGASGAITALGDTLVFGGGISPTESALVASLVDLRIYHPILALVTGGFVALAAWTARVQRPSPTTRRLSTAIWVVYGMNLLLGAVNVALMAPVWIQIVHLLITDTIWILLVLLGAAALDHRLAEADPIPEVSEALDSGVTA